MNFEKHVEDLIRRHRELDFEIRVQLQHFHHNTDLIKCLKRQKLRLPKPPSQTWRTFLNNHVGCLASIDFFVVPTARFAVLFVFIVLRHERSLIEHFGVTSHPTADLVGQQMREAFPWDTALRYLIRDRDGAYGQSFRSTVMAMGVEEVVTAPPKPVAESVCGTPDRQREARVPESRDRLE